MTFLMGLVYILIGCLIGVGMEFGVAWLKSRDRRRVGIVSGLCLTPGPKSWEANQQMTPEFRMDFYSFPGGRRMASVFADDYDHMMELGCAVVDAARLEVPSAYGVTNVARATEQAVRGG